MGGSFGKTVISLNYVSKTWTAWSYKTQNVPWFLEVKEYDRIHAIEVFFFL